MEREVRIFMQDERQRVHGRTRSVHFKDICKKGESKLTFREYVIGLGTARKEDGEIFPNFCFHNRFCFHTAMCEREIPQIKNRL